MPRVFLSLGSNIDAHENIRSALDVLRELYPDMLVSTIYESESVGFQGDNFFNLVVAFNSEDDVEAIDANMNEIEEMHGRMRNAERYVARTLDIDLLLYGDLIDADMNLPRNEIDEFAFVLLPLTELAPDMPHPVTGETFAEMWERFHKGDQDLWAVDLNDE